MEIEDSENDIRLWIPLPVHEEIRRNDQTHKALFETHDCTIHLFACTVHSFACTVHSFTCSALLASLTRSAALIHWFTRSLTHSRACGKVNDKMSQKNLVLSHSASKASATKQFLRNLSSSKTPHQLRPKQKEVKFKTKTSTATKQRYHLLFCLSPKNLAICWFLSLSFITSLFLSLLFCPCLTLFVISSVFSSFLMRPLYKGLSVRMSVFR